MSEWLDTHPSAHNPGYLPPRYPQKPNLIPYAPDMAYNDPQRRVSLSEMMMKDNPSEFMPAVYPNAGAGIRFHVADPIEQGMWLRKKAMRQQAIPITADGFSI